MNILKKSVRLCFLKAKRYRMEKKEIRRIKKVLNSDPSIPELTREQSEEIKAFWNRYGIDMPLYWHRFLYGRTGIYTPAFVSEPVFHYIIKRQFNELSFAAVWSDKCYLDYFVRSAKSAECVLRNVNGRFLNSKFELVTIQEAQKIIDQHEKLVVKPSTNTNTGKGVLLLQSPINLTEIHKKYMRNYVLQCPVQQHPKMGKLNESSVNTIRVNSLLLENEAYIMSAFVKVGESGQFADNNGSDRYFIGIKQDGTFADYAINHDMKSFSSIPSGYSFSGQKVPSYDKVCECIRNAHKCIAHFGFAFWDVCIDKDGEPVILEVNLKNPDTLIAQAAAGPFMGEYTETILKRISKQDLN